MPGAEHREQVVDRRAHLAQVALDVGERRGADRDHDVVGLGRVDGAIGELEAPAREHALEQLLGSRLAERHPAGADRGQHGLVVIHAEHAEAPVGEAQRERQPDAPEADDRYGPRTVHEWSASAAVTLRNGVRPGSAACPRTSPENAIRLSRAISRSPSIRAG